MIEIKIEIYAPQTKVKRIDVYNEKKRIIESCDDAFIYGIVNKKDYLNILNKIDQNAYLIGIYNSDQPIGYAAIYANDYESKVAYISMIGVVKRMQGMHIGSKLMIECIEIAKKEHMHIIRLEVLKNNIQAIKFYRRYGFEEEMESSTESLYMKKNI